MAQGFKEIEVKVCPVCGRFFHQNKWKTVSLEDAIRTVAVSKIVGIKKPWIEFDLPKPEKKGKKRFLIKVNEYEIPAAVVSEQCPYCRQARSKYFEAIIQLRGNLADSLPFFEQEFSRNGEVSISDRKKSPNGIDLYATSQRFAKAVGKKLQEKFGGTLLVSSRIYGPSKKTGKDVYRVTVLYEAPSIPPGKIIAVDGRIIVVKKTGKQIEGKDILTGKNVYLKKPRQMPEPLEVYTVQITKKYPKLAVLHPETFQEIIIENQPKQMPKGETAEIVLFEEKAYIVSRG